MSRQYEWQKKKIKEGKCRQCGKPRINKNYCEVCRDKIREYKRNEYREKVGIPLDAPLIKSGRPKQEGL